MVTIALESHQQMWHIGPYKLKEILSGVLWHPDINKVTKDITSTCLWCQKNKPNALTVIPPTIKIRTNRPFEMIAVDLIALPRTCSGYVGCFVLVDHFSKWLSMMPIKNKTGETIAKQIEKCISTLPAKPSKCLSDNGPEFRSKEFTKILEKYSIEHILTTPYKPQSNGAVERVNRTVIQLFKALADNPARWDEDLAQLVIIYNQTFHEELQCSPSQCLLQQIHNVEQGPLIDVNTQNMWKTGHPNFVPYQRNDWILKKREVKGNLVIDKFKEKYEGPYQIHKVMSNKVTYEIITEDNQIIRAHHTQLRKVRLTPNYLKKFIEYLVDESNIYTRELDIKDNESNSDFQSVNNTYEYWTIDTSVSDTNLIVDLGRSDICNLTFPKLNNRSAVYNLIVQKLNQRVEQIKTRRSISNNSNKSLYIPIPLTDPSSYILQERFLKPTMTVTKTNDCNIVLGTDGTDSEIVIPSKNKTSANNEENCSQSDQSAWLAEENNVVLLSLSHNEKIVLSKVKPVEKIDKEGNENTDSEVELVPADLNSKNNQISQVKIITENGQTFDFWNVSAIQTPSDCDKLNKTVNSDEILSNYSVFIEQLSWISEVMIDISQQCMQVSDADKNRNTEVPEDSLGISMMTNTERETLMNLITPIINEVRDLRSFINENRRKARDRLLNANRDGLTIYSDDEFSGFQLDDHEVDVPNTYSDDNRPRTRSQGPVKDMPWILP